MARSFWFKIQKFKIQKFLKCLGEGIQVKMHCDSTNKDLLYST